MAEAHDVVILGAGFAGAATAYHLAERGVRRILVLEREPRAGMHASGKNAALAFQLIANLDEARLAIEGTRIYASPPPELHPRPLLARRGSVLLFDEGERTAWEMALRDGRKLGLPVAELSPDEAVRRIPALEGSRFGYALENPADGVVDIRALLEGYLERARRAGAVVRFGAPATALRRRGTRVAAVVTPDAEYEAASVVNVAGPWAGEIGKLAGVGDRTVFPRRRHVFRVRSPRAVDPEAPFVWHSSIDAYFRPEEDGALLTSACDATAHPCETPEVDEHAEAHLREKLGRAFPALGAVEVLEARACLRTFVADETFFIGRDPDLENLVWVAGLGGHGMSTSWAVGRLAAGAVVDGWVPGLDRFSTYRRMIV